MMNQQLFDMLEAAALKMNTTVEHLWGVLTQQAYIHSLSMIASLVVGFIASIVIFKFTSKKVVGWSDRDFGMYNFLMVISGVSIIISIILTLVSIEEMMTFLNPEYYAFQELKSILK